MKEVNSTHRKTEKGRLRTCERSRAFRASAIGKKKCKTYKRSEKCRAANRRYQQSEKGKAMLKRCYQRDLASGKRQARWTLGNAIRAGKIPRAKTQKCNRCDKQAQHYHHHLGYSLKHLLSVVPLCAQCHKNADRTNPTPSR